MYSRADKIDGANSKAALSGAPFQEQKFPFMGFTMKTGFYHLDTWDIQVKLILSSDSNW